MMIGITLKKIHHSISGYSNDKLAFMSFRPIEIKRNHYCTQLWDGEISQTLHTVLSVLNQIFQLKISDEIHFFLIIIYKLIPLSRKVSGVH